MAFTTLSGLFAELSNPADTANVSDLPLYARDVRNFLYTFLGQAHADNGVLGVDSVNADQIKAGAVGTTKIADGAVTEVKLASNAVTTPKIANGNVTAEKLAAGAISAANVIADGTIINAHVNAAAAIDGSKLANGTVDTPQLTDLAVTGDKIALATITGDKIANNTIEPTAFKTTNSAAGLASSSVALPVLDTAVPTNSRVAVIGGALTATLVAGNPPTLSFKLSSDLGAGTGTMFSAHRASTGANVAGEQVLTGWSVDVENDELVEIYGDGFKVHLTGQYLVHVAVAVYSVGGAVICLRESAGPTRKAFSPTIYCPPGVQGVAQLLHVLNVTTEDKTYDVSLYCETVKAVNGLGLLNALPGSPTIHNGKITFFKLS